MIKKRLIAGLLMLIGGGAISAIGSKVVLKPVIEAAKDECKAEIKKLREDDEKEVEE